MTSRDRIRTIIGGAPADRCGFWLGNPHPTSLPALYAYFGVDDLERLHRKLGSDLRWLSPQLTASVYRHPGGKGLFDIGQHKRSHAEEGPLASCTTVREIESYEWPDPLYLDFSESLRELTAAGDHYRASGFWMPFFHDVIDLLGFEPLMMAMHDRGEIVHAVCEQVCGFYLDANERFFAAAPGMVDATFFGNDFGTQRDLLISEAHFDEFFLPWIRRFAEQGRRHGLQVMMHSCGSVHRIIDRLIDAGVHCLHPLQALAQGMDAGSLVRRFGGRMSFLGGIDTQELLRRGTPAAIREEVRRLHGSFGARWIASPSHEALLPDIPPGNIAAMAEAVFDLFS